MEFHPKHTRIFQKAAKIYQNGSSLPEVCQKLGLPKSSVVDGLKDLRGRRQLRPSTPSYGYLCVAGKLVEHPFEQNQIHIIRELGRRGMKAWRIVEELSRLKIKPRKGRRWSHKTIGKILGP